MTPECETHASIIEILKVDAKSVSERKRRQVAEDKSGKTSEYCGM